MNIGEINGVQVAVSPEAYEEIKKQKIIEENKILKEQQQELERYKNIIEKAITFINIFQDEKTLTLNYNNLRHLRGILKGNDFDLMILEYKLKELKGSGE